MDLSKQSRTYSESTKQTEMAPGEPATYKKPAKEIPQ